MNTHKKQISRLRLTAFAIGGLVLSGSLAMAQAVRQDTPEATAPNAAPVPVTTQSVTPPPIDDDIIMLSPFQVDASRDKGYFAENTLAGSRMKTNISDLGAAISVVTKQQMEDTASLDINDVFRYEVNTEGSNTYTPIVGNARSASGFADTIGGNNAGNTGGTSTNATSNRMRGLSAPSMGINYYIALSQVPFDSYNTASVEINRGPNSFLFGMGNPSGMVNQSTAQALLNKNTAQVSLRIDDRGSNRASFNFNKSLIKDKLAVYGAFLYNDQQFERKPSYDMTRRQYGAITYRPFKGTVLRASIEGYNNDNRRPNFMTPRDFVSEWIKGGKPYYDAKNARFVKGDGTIVPYTTSVKSPNAEALVAYAQSVGGSGVIVERNSDGSLKSAKYNGIDLFTSNAITNPLSPMYIQGIAPWLPRPFQMIDGGQSVGFYEATADRQIPSWGTPMPAVVPSEADIWANPTWAAAYIQQYSRSAGGVDTTLKTYIDPGVSSSSIYDWSSINTLQMNFGNARNTNYNLELEQEIIPRLLHFAGGWFRQDYDSVANYTVAQLDSATLYVDTNRYLPTGDENPYFGQVFLEDIDPDTWGYGITSDQYRGQLAFTPDFTKNKGWTRWLGRHNILGLVSQQKTTSTTMRQRLMFTDAENRAKLRYLPNPDYDGGAWSYVDGHGSRLNRREDGRSIERLYYLSSPGDPGGKATHSAGAWNGATSYTGDIVGYNYDTSSWESYNMTLGLATHSATTKRSQTKLTSYAVGSTSYFWNDRIIATLGIRRDEYKARESNSGGSRVLTSAEKWVDGRLQTETWLENYGRWTELAGTTNTVGFVVKPFQGWNAIEKRATDNLFWEFIRDFGVSYNRANVFNAPSGNVNDFFGNPLPKATGVGKDYGVQFSLFNQKLFARVSWFNTTSENAYANPGNAMTRLSERTDLGSFRAWAERIVLLNKSDWDPTQYTTTDWVNHTRSMFASDAEFQAEVAKVWGMPYDYYSRVGTVSGTQDQEAKGMEMQMTYNPTSNWTMRLTVGKQKTTYNNVLKEFYAWYNHRNVNWEGARAADFLDANKQQYAVYRPLNASNDVVLTDFWNSSGYIPEYGPGNAYNYLNAKDYYNGVVLPEVSLATDLQGQMTPGQRKWRAAFVTNYTFTRGALKGFAVGGGERWESKAIIGYYGKASGVSGVQLDLSDTTRPIYDSANWYTDLWVSYTCKIFNDKVRMKLQLNVTDVFQDGELRVVKRDYHGRAIAYRIMDPRTFILSASFDF